MHEKAWSMPMVTIHRRLENSQVGMLFVHKWLRKRPYTLCRSCRGMGDLQLFYYVLGPLLLKNLEQIAVEQSQIKFKTSRPRRARDVACARPRWSQPYVAVPVVHERQGGPATDGSSAEPQLLCVTSVDPLDGATCRVHTGHAAPPTHRHWPTAACTSPPPFAVPLPCCDPHRDYPQLCTQATAFTRFSHLYPLRPHMREHRAAIAPPLAPHSVSSLLRSRLLPPVHA
jgi:hypothetical protein